MTKLYLINEDGKLTTAARNWIGQDVVAEIIDGETDVSVLDVDQRAKTAKANREKVAARDAALAQAQAEADAAAAADAQKEATQAGRVQTLRTYLQKARDNTLTGTDVVQIVRLLLLYTFRRDFRD